MAKAKTKAAGTNLPVPQNDAEAEQLIARLGVLEREDREAEVAHDAAVAALEEKRGTAVKVFKEVQSVIVEALNIWATANRDRLTEGGKKKTVQFPTGKLIWYDGAASVALNNRKVSKTGKEVVPIIEARIAQIREVIKAARGRKDRDTARAQEAAVLGFLRFTVTLNREAMHDAPDLAQTIPGITFKKPGEDFKVEPLASQISEVVSS